MRYVAFPKLGIKFNIERSAFSLFGMDVYWYGLIIALGLVMGTLCALLVCKKTKISKESIYDLVLYGLPSAIVGARLYYVIFKWDLYKNNLIDIFNLRGGGLAIYGGVIGAVISTYIYSRVKKINFLKLLDTGAPGLICGQMIGRWGNFFNQEAFGTNTSSLLGMTGTDIISELAELKAQGFSVNPDMCVHPTFLYESLWNLCVLIIVMYVIFKKLDFDGKAFFTYISLYGLGRFFIEGLRVDSLYIGIFRVSQLVALLCVLAGVGLIIYGNRKNKNAQSLSC